MKATREEIKLYSHSELKLLLERKAKACNETLTEYVNAVLAVHVGKPKLRNPPLGKIGRPRKAVKGSA